MLHTFDEPCYMKNEKYMKSVIVITFFHSFIIFRVEGSIKSMQHGYSFDEELNSTSNECSYFIITTIVL